MQTKKSFLILMRHGQSTWNQKNLFTGWVDVPLTELGIEEARRGGKKMAHLPIDVAFTSTLVRAHMTLQLSLLHHHSQKTPIFIHKESPEIRAWETIHREQPIIPVYASSALNERYYGDLQGLNKEETAQKYGKAQVQLWRRSFDTPPPNGESLAMTAQRTLPYFQKTIIPCLEQGQSVFVCAHGNSLRSIVMELDRLTKEEVVDLEIATGEPLLYEWMQGRWKQVQLI